MSDERRAEIEGQRESIAWCGQCGNISVDGINFIRVEGGLQCAGCGAVSPHFEYVRKSSLDRVRDAQGDDEPVRLRDELTAATHAAERALESLDAMTERALDAEEHATRLEVERAARSPQGEDHEALQRAVRAFVESWWEFDSLPPQDHYNAVAERVQVLEDALDRLRDARGDDPHELAWREAQGELDRLRAELAATRSPQGEDHEEGIDRGQLLRDIGKCREDAAFMTRLTAIVSENADTLTLLGEPSLEALIPYVHAKSGFGIHNCDFEECRIEPCPLLRSLLARVSAPKADENQEAR